MQSTIPEGAPTNPFHDYVEDYANMNRNYHPSDFRRHGAYSWIEIPEELKVKITESVIKIQNTLIPTIKGLRNERNISQLQNRVYLKMKKYEDQYNTCHFQSRNVQQVYVCGDKLLNGLNVQMPQHIKKILDEF